MCYTSCGSDGVKKPKYDGIIIRQSRVQDGKVLILAGAPVYKDVGRASLPWLDDTVQQQ
jgi:hypothetical protein